MCSDEYAWHRSHCGGRAAVAGAVAAVVAAVVAAAVAVAVAAAVAVADEAVATVTVAAVAVVAVAVAVAAEIMTSIGNWILRKDYMFEHLSTTLSLGKWSAG
jgi:hypothetical protein